MNELSDRSTIQRGGASGGGGGVLPGGLNDRAEPNLAEDGFAHEGHVHHDADAARPPQPPLLGYPAHVPPHLHLEVVDVRDVRGHHLRPSHWLPPEYIPAHIPSPLPRLGRRQRAFQRTSPPRGELERRLSPPRPL
eukprot:579840-Prorocentrum_minimum.AAC.1